MPMNTSPGFTAAGRVSTVAIAAANVKTDGSGTVGTDIFVAFTPGANGSLITKAVWTPVNSTIGTATTATVGRLFVASTDTGTLTPGTDVWSIGEWTLVSQTPTATAAVSPIVAQLNLLLPSGFYLLATTHHAPAANTGQHLAIFGGDY